MKKSAKFLLVLLLFILFVVAGAVIYIYSQVSPVSKTSDSEKIRVEIPSGTSVKKTANILKNLNLIKNEDLFYIFAREPRLKKLFFPKEDSSVQFVLKSGIYYVSPSMNIAQIQNLLTSGQQEFVKLSIPEGLTISKIAALLEENRICSAENFMEASQNPQTLQKYSIPANNFEGYLFPDTYYLNLEMDANLVVQLMLDNFFEKISTIPNIDSLDSQKLFETITLASIVEREYRVKDEAPLIASVFKNRIKENIGLYSCATIEYIITEIEKRPHPDKILIEDTKINNPYNTYKWAGLPPGPISNPGLVAIDSCVNTPKTNYYFFQVINQEEGRHVFTTTFEEHKVNHNLTTKKAAGK